MVLISSLLALPLLTTPQPLVVPHQDELFSFSAKPIQSMLSHPKDAGLLRILELLPARIEALAVENGEQVPPGLVAMIADLITAGKTLRIATGSPDGPIPIQASFSFDATNAEEAGARNEYLMSMLRGSGAPLGEQMASGLYSLEIPIPMLVGIGTIGNEFVVTVGTDSPLPATIAAPSLPYDISPDWQMSMQLGKLYEMIGSMAPVGSDEAEMFSMFSSSLGSLNFSMAGGHDAERSYTTLIQGGAARMAREANAMPSSGISAQDLGLIPADAQLAVLMKVNLEASVDMGLNMVAPILEQAASREGDTGIDDPLALLAQMTGLDLRADFFPHLGETMGFYMSDSTGGGTMASAVAIVEITNAQGMHDFIDQICELMSPMWQDAQMHGLTIQRSTVNADGVELNTMTFPGMPIPVEPTYALMDKWLVFGLSPQATRAAVWQIRSGTPGLRDNPRFVEQAQALNASDSAMVVEFFDAPALLADGYTWMNLLMSAAANGLRTGGSPDPGMLLDPYPVLAQDAKAWLQVSTYEGDDLVARAASDASMMVNLTGLAGFIDRSGLMMVLPLAWLTARESASTAASFEAFDYAMPPDEVEASHSHSDAEHSDHSHDDI